MFRTDSGDGGNRLQSAERTRQPLPDPSQHRSKTATGLAAVSRQASSTGWRAELHRLEPLNLPLLPCGAGAEQKGPINHKTGRGLTGWTGARFTVPEILAMNGVVRSVGTRTGDGCLCFDIDGGTAIELALEHGCDPQQAHTWQVHRTTDPLRLKVLFSLTPEQQQQLGTVITKALTLEAPRDSEGKGEALELFHSPGKQVILLGEHPSSGGQYIWPDGHGPEALQPIPDCWWQLATKIAAGELGISPASAARPSRQATSSTGWKPINPCPICGRNTTSWCTHRPDNGAINCRHGSTFSPVLAHGVLKVGATITGTNGVVYGYCGDAVQTNGDTFSSFVVHTPRQQQQKPRKAAPVGAPPPADAPPPKAHYRVLGWNTSLDAIWVQTSEAGIVGSVPLSKAGLQRIAPIGYWEALFPGRFGTEWDAAISNVRDAAEALGTFTPDRIRGRGIWLDNDRVIWHLGNRIEVDGHQLHLTELRDSAYTYASLPALDINPEVPQITDAEGTAILELFTKRMQWGNDGDGLLVAGHTVLGNVCAALDYRPGLQLTGGSGDGKSTTLNKSIAPLQAGLALRTSGATEAGIRQTMKMDALPVVIDESEQENARQREGHLHLLRLSFDGQQQVKGTPGGKSLTYTMRSMITLIGINAAVPNTADRNRLVVVRPRKLQPVAWRQFQLQRDKLITIEAGRRLIRRTVSNLPALLANIKTFTAVLASQKGTDRTHQVIGSLLAGAHHLTSTAVLDADAALAWLDAVGWNGLDEDALEATSADAEAKACRDHLLAYTVQWKATQTGSITVLELLQIVQNTKVESTEAAAALGRLGIKWDRERGLVVANSCKVYAGSKWANGNHRDHLLSLDKAQAVPSAQWFTGMGSKKAVSLPLPAETT